MSYFATLKDAAAPVRVIVVGAGGMGRTWLRTIAATEGVELVGLVDISVDAANAALVTEGITGIPTRASLDELIAATSPDAVINVTIPEAHHPVTMQAIYAGVPVLCEKPLAPTVAEGLSMAAAAEATGQLVMVSQSRRYYNTLAAFKRQAHALGEIGILTTEFFKAPRFEGFRLEMAHLLLLDMSIHPFDSARYLLEQEPVSVYCEEFNPRWGWNTGASVASAIFEFDGGARYAYTGSWVSEGFETSWNGVWRASAEGGTATWDGETAPQVSTGVDILVDSAPPEEIGGALAEFVQALRTGEKPSGDVHYNLKSLAMVEAAVRSSETRSRVLISEVLESAYEKAVADEQRPDVAAVLKAWPSVTAALA